MLPIGLFGDVTALKRKPQTEEALQILKRLAAQVEPIMKKRGWKVRTLKEMYPKNPNLLGLNYGKTIWISIRLRQPYNDTHFIAYPSLLDTLLHDAHDQHFHNLWRELESECETLIMQGRTGIGFLGQGRKLGGIPKNRYGLPHLPTPKAIEPTSNPTKFPGKGNKVGTNLKDLVIPSGSRPSPTILDYLRRSAITARHPQSSKSTQALSWCAGSSSSSERGVKPSKHDDNEVIVISDDDSDVEYLPPDKNDSWSCPTCSCQNPPLFLQCLACMAPCPTDPSLPLSLDWPCPTCTLINPPTSPHCQVCDTPKLKSESSLPPPLRQDPDRDPDRDPKRPRV